MSFDVVGVFVGDAEMVVNIAFVIRTDATAATESGDRISIIKEPTDPVDVVAACLLYTSPSPRDH